MKLSAKAMRSPRPRYDRRCDAFSFGVLLLELADHERVYGEYCGSPSLTLDFRRPDVGWLAGSWAAEYVDATWVADPAARMAFEELAPRLEALAGLDAEAVDDDAPTAQLLHEPVDFTLSTMEIVSNFEPM